MIRGGDEVGKERKKVQGRRRHFVSAGLRSCEGVGKGVSGAMLFRG